MARWKERIFWNGRFFKLINMTRQKYAGTWTAIITPFKEDGSVDEMALRNLVRRQVDNGVTGVVPVGTTGESPTTTAEEDNRIFKAPKVRPSLRANRRRGN